MTELLYLEDLPVGRRFHSAAMRVEQASVLEFAGNFDPQPFHLDEDAARRTIFGRVAASGWHTAAMTMRLILDAFPNAGGVISPGFDELRWPRPVYPGDRLAVEIEVLEARPSRSTPEGGWLKLRLTTTNQDGTVVLAAVANVMAIRRTGVTT